MASTDSKMSRLLSKQALDSFSRIVTSFQGSSDPFRIICTLPASTQTQCEARGHVDPPLPRRPSRTPRHLIILDSSFNPPTVAHHAMLKSAIRSIAPAVSNTKDAGPTRRVLLLLSVNNADKAAKPASFPARLCMMEAFAQGILAERDSLAGRNSFRSRSTEDPESCLEVDIAITKMPFFHDKSEAIVHSGFYDGQGHEDIKDMRHLFLIGFDTLIRVFNPKYYPPAAGEAGAAEQGVGMASALDPFFERAVLRVTAREDDEWGGLAEQRAHVTSLADGGKLAELGGREEWMKGVELVEGDEDGKRVSSSKVRAMVKNDEDWKGSVGDGVRWWIEEEDLYKEE